MVEVGALVWANGMEGRPVIGREDIERIMAHLIGSGDEGGRVEIKYNGSFCLLLSLVKRP